MIMISQKLHDARQYEAAAEKRIPEDDRPAFHLSARSGWMNDPNGFCFYRGRYHMFYQYYPFKASWASMHWGHAVSDDLLHWEYFPAALAPDQLYDQDGVFSGSAIELEDGRLLLMYTGVRCEAALDGSPVEVQSQCVAVGDGIDFEKWPQNPVLDETSLPAGASRNDFRDPKLFRLKDGRYGCIAVSRSEDLSGQVLLFTSGDALSWQYEATLIRCRHRFGNMWECPDFFELDGKQVCLVSPMNMLPDGSEYHCGNGTLCLIGSYDEETSSFQEEHDQAVDYGIDFYAPQTVLTPDGRRIMIGWMQNVDGFSIREPGSAWAGQMSLPRELHVLGSRLYQRPTREFDALRRSRIRYEQVTVGADRLYLDGISGRMVDMEVTICPKDTPDSFEMFEIRFAEKGPFWSSVRYRPRESSVAIDREFSGSRRAILHQRRCILEDVKNKLKLRIILDRFSCEVFIDDGRKVMTMTYYTDLSADGISFIAEGEAVMDIIKYDIQM